MNGEGVRPYVKILTVGALVGVCCVPAGLALVHVGTAAGWALVWAGMMGFAAAAMVVFFGLYIIIFGGLAAALVVVAAPWLLLERMWRRVRR